MADLALRGQMSVSLHDSPGAEMAGAASGGAVHIEYPRPSDEDNLEPGTAAESEDESAEVEISDSGSQDGLFEVREPTHLLSHQLIVWGRLKIWSLSGACAG